MPPEVTFDGVRVACHLYPEGSDGVPVTIPPPDAIGPTVSEVGPPAPDVNAIADLDEDAG